VAARYHEETLRALGIAYAPDAAAMSALEARAAGLGVTFPASFVEWYGMQEGILLLRQHSNSDEPIGIDSLGMPAHLRPWRAEADASTGPVLEFMVENQGVCIWAVRLDAGDDPPVLVAVDPGYEWRPHASTFSSFIACQVWDHPEEDERVRLAAQAVELSPHDLAEMRRRFCERATTHGWPTTNIFRFERDDARVLIWDADGQADWWLSAESDVNVTALARELWAMGNLKSSLYGIDKRGDAILSLLREER
jgi:hypothetical protein